MRAKKLEKASCSSMAEELLIDQVTDVTHGVYQPYGWHHWPKYPWMSYQFRRALGETQEGGGAVSECFLAASRMIPGRQGELAPGMEADRGFQPGPR